MDAVYSNRFKVHLHEVDAAGNARISTILNYFQNTSSEQSANLGFAVTDLMKRGLTWVVSRYHIHILRYPAWKESVVVNTWRAGLSGNYALREFEVCDGAGEPLVLATSSFALLDLKKKRPVSPVEHLPGYPELLKRALNDDFKTLPVPAENHHATEFKTRRQDIDINRHVNNTLYVEWALENVPDDIFNSFQPSEIEVSFRGEAFYGDIVLSLAEKVYGDPAPLFAHRIVRPDDGKELARLRTSWVSCPVNLRHDNG